MRIGKDLGAKLIVACSFTDVELVPSGGRLVKAFGTRGFKLSVVLLFDYIVLSFPKG